MSLLKQFADFETLVDIGFTEHVSSDGLTIRQGGIEFTVVKNTFGSASAVDPEVCITFPCQVAHVGQAQFSAIGVRGAPESTLGYVFPLASLADGSRVDGEWPRKYGWVAANALLRDAGRFLPGSSDLSLASLSGGETSLDRIFPGQLGVAVLGLSTLARFKIAPDTARLMLMAGGIRFPRHVGVSITAMEADEWEPTIRCPKPTEDFDCDEAFELLVEIADGTDSVVGVFLTLYQSFEMLLARVFVASAQSAFSEGVSPWKLKERLGKMASERWRYAILDRDCIEGADRSSLSSLTDECRAFLSSSGEVVKDGALWWQLLYGVRNILVHSQHRVIKEQYFNLTAINAKLRASSLSILLSYREPDTAELWKEVEVPAD